MIKKSRHEKRVLPRTLVIISPEADALNTANTWNETASKCYQLGLTIENAGSSSLNGWTVVVTFNAPVSTDNFWCCGVSIKDKVMTLTPADFNKTIGAGSQTSDIGLIVQSKSLLKIESIEVKTK